MYDVWSTVRLQCHNLSQVSGDRPRVPHDKSCVFELALQGILLTSALP